MFPSPSISPATLTLMTPKKETDTLISSLDSPLQIRLLVKSKTKTLENEEKKTKKKNETN